MRLLCFFFLITTLPAQWVSSRIQGSPEPAKPFVAEQVYPQAQFTQALEMAAIPGVHRWAIVEQKGKVWTMPDAGDGSEKTLLIDLKTLHPPLANAFGIAFHPRWRENGYVFITLAEGNKLPEGSKLLRYARS
jgi:hypothetical protein